MMKVMLEICGLNRKRDPRMTWAMGARRLPKAKREPQVSVAQNPSVFGDIYYNQPC